MDWNLNEAALDNVGGANWCLIMKMFVDWSLWCFIEEDDCVKRSTETKNKKRNFYHTAFELSAYFNKLAVIFESHQCEVWDRKFGQEISFKCETNRFKTFKPKITAKDFWFFMLTFNNSWIRNAKNKSNK